MQYDKNGRLTRAGAIQVIQSGGSVTHAGKMYSRVESLPSEAEFAKGDPQQEIAARERLQAQIADAQKQLAQLSSDSAPAARVPAPAKPVEPAGDDDVKEKAKAARPK